MKAFLGEYGKIIITILIGLTLFIFIFSNKSDGFRASLPKPTVTYGTTTSKNTVNEITGRSKPFLTFLSDAKLSVNQTYDLENKDQMKIQAENANGTPLPIEVTSIIDNNNNTVSLSTKNNFKPSPGYYTVYYRVKETYKGATLVTERYRIFSAN